MHRAIGATAALFAFCAIHGPAAAEDSYRPESGALLQLAAEGNVEVAPDVMSVSASVVTTGSTAAEALERNNQLAAQVIEAVRTSRIRIAQLQTTGLDVNARFAESERDEEAPPQILGYVANNTLEVELADVAQAGELISLMFEAGANEIRGPYFYLRDPEPAQREAERAAIAAARVEADNYAAALGMRVARVLRVFDGRFDDRQGNTITVTGSRIQPTPIEPGEVTYSATVNVEFLLEPQ